MAVGMSEVVEGAGAPNLRDSNLAGERRTGSNVYLPSDWCIGNERDEERTWKLRGKYVDSRVKFDSFHGRLILLH